MRRPLIALLVAGLLGAAGLGLTWATLPAVASLATNDPASTALIEQRVAEAGQAHRPFRVHRTPVPLTAISPRLIDAVLLSEDAGFYVHDAFDWGELRNAAEKDLKAHRYVRGASTLTQQLAKNLFLGSQKTLWRKFREALLSVKIERTLTKRRILGLYLNAVEWGDGTFGAEAGAQRLFSVGARSLDVAQAAVMAAMLPAPRRISMSSPPRWLGRRARHVVELMWNEGRINDEEHAAAVEELERILAGGPSSGDEDAEPPAEEDPDDAPAPSTNPARGK
jgi:monofunctional glycosyltransferase